MNWDQIEGKWKELRGKAKSTWGKLTHQDLEVIRGQRKQLVGKIQQIYGLLKEEAEKQVDEFANRLEPRKVHLIIRRTVKRSTSKPSKTSSKVRKGSASRR